MTNKTAHQEIVEGFSKALKILKTNGYTNYELDKALALLDSHTVAPNEPSEEMVDVGKISYDLRLNLTETTVNTYRRMIQKARGE